jgi:hypothetical protein
METSYHYPAERLGNVQKEEMSEDFDLTPEEFEQLMEYYIEIGAVELTGMLPNGEPVYRMTDAAAELVPELWYMHMQSVDEAMVDLFEQGLVNIEYDEELNVSFKITDEGKEAMESLGFIEIQDDKFSGDE